MFAYKCQSSRGSARRLVLVSVLAILSVISSCSAQFAYHTDAHTNSFTLKTPSLQQSFTRYYGGQGANLQQAQQQQPLVQQQNSQPQAQYSAMTAANPQYQQQPQQQQQYSSQYAQPQPTQFAGAAAAPISYQQAAAQYAQTLQQFQALQSQQQQQPQTQIQPSQQQTQYTPHQQQYAEQLKAYYAQQQQQQQQQQQMYSQQQLLKQLYQNRPASGNVGSTTAESQPQQANQFYTAEQYANYMNGQHQVLSEQQQQQVQQQYYASPTQATHSAGTYTSAGPSETTTPTVAPRNGLQYSPSDQVSHVKFQSGNLAYNF